MSVPWSKFLPSSGLVAWCSTTVLTSNLLCAPLAMAESIGQRPSLTATSYIHVAPVASFSTDFVKLIAGAVQHADGVQAAAARWQAEKFGVDAAVGAQLPSGSIYGEAGMANGTNTTPYSYGVRVSVPLYDGYSAGFATDAQRATAEAAHDGALDELSATLVDLVVAAAAIRRAAETLDARRAQRVSVQDLLATMVREREAGIASRVDTDQVEAQLAQVDIDIASAQSARLQAEESFAGIAGSAPDHVGAIGSIARLLPATLDAGLALAMRENPKLAQRIGLALAAQFNAKSVHSSFGPALSLDLSAGARGDVLGTTASAADVRAVIRLQVPLAFGTEAVVRKSAHTAQAAEFETNAARNGVTAGLSSAYARLANSRRSLSLAYDALERARSVRAGMTVERDLGERSIFELLGAQSSFAEAQIRVASLTYDIVVAEHLLAAQLGRIDDIYGVSLD